MIQRYSNLDKEIQMPFGRYAGRAIRDVYDGRELEMWLREPYSNFLTDRQIREIESQLNVADRSHRWEASRK